MADSDVDETEPHEGQRDNRGGEHFEEAFDPEVDYPPAPILCDGEVGVLARDQARGIEESDGRHGKHEDQKELPASRVCLGRPPGPK